MKKSSRILSLIIVLLVVVSLTACQTAPAAPAQPESPAQPEAPAQPSEAEKVTLKVWDIFVRPEETAIMEAMIARYTSANPNVTIVREAKSSDDLKAATSLALSSPDGPDVVMVNQGQSDMGALVAAGLLLPLDGYASEYGWFDKFPAGLVKLNSWSEGGKQMGIGDFYALPIQSEVVGAFYRKDLFQENNLSIPATYADFEKAMETLKQAGITPITYGGLDGWPAIHLYSEIENAELAERTWYDEFMYLTGSVNFDVPANLEAARGLQGWVEKGYLTDGFEGIGYDDSWQLFSAGEGAMMLTGSWMSADLLAGPNGENIGFFPIPPKTEDGFKLSVGGTGYGFAIRSTSSQPELAAEYINYLYSEETARQMLDAGFFPVYPLDTSGLDDGLVKDIAQAWVSLNETDSIGYYMDWVTPTMYDTITASLQELMAGQITPEQFVTQVNDDYVKFLKEKGVN